MSIKSVYFIFVIVIIYLIQNTNAYPRDVGVVKLDSVSDINVDLPKVTDAPMKASSEQDASTAIPVIPGRLPCPHQEATEDATCQDHCLPKGYSYGICVSGTCSCI